MSHMRWGLHAMAGMLLALLIASVLFSIGGTYALVTSPEVTARAGRLLPLLMKGPTWVFLIAVPALVFLLFFRDRPWRTRLLMLGLGSSIGLAAELIGTTTGYPFGGYSYTDFLGPKILGHVPYVIPVSWYAMSVISLDMATRLGLSLPMRISVGALFMVLWDLALDPAMVAAFPVWIWHVDGFFYGMPFLNLIGWFITSVVILAGYEAVTGSIEPAGRWTYAIWLSAGALPVGLLTVRELWLGAAIGALSTVIPPLAVYLRGSVRRPVLLAARQAT